MDGRRPVSLHRLRFGFKGRRAQLARVYTSRRRLDLPFMLVSIANSSALASAASGLMSVFFSFGSFVLSLLCCMPGAGRATLPPTGLEGFRSAFRRTLVQLRSAHIVSKRAARGSFVCVFGAWCVVSKKPLTIRDGEAAC